MSRRTGVPTKAIRRIVNQAKELAEAADEGDRWWCEFEGEFGWDRDGEMVFDADLSAVFNETVVKELASAGVDLGTQKRVKLETVGRGRYRFGIEGRKGK